MGSLFSCSNLTFYIHHKVYLSIDITLYVGNTMVCPDICVLCTCNFLWFKAVSDLSAIVL